MTALPTDGRKIYLHYQHRKCGSSKCKKCKASKGHGPYWYAYWRDDAGKMRSKYIGKNAPVRPEPDQLALEPEPASV